MPTEPCRAAPAAFPSPGTPEHIAVLAHGTSGLSIALVETAKCQIEVGLNLANDGNDTVTLANVVPVTIKPAPKGLDQTQLMLMGGARASLQIAGSLESMLEVSVRYSNERVAFEKKISKFQAVQHNLGKLAGQSAAALAAATSAADAMANSNYLRTTKCSSKRCRQRSAVRKRPKRARRSPTRCTARSGFTIEHILHRYSLRALAWRDDFGSESYWAVELGKLVTARGADELWPLVASR